MFNGFYSVKWFYLETSLKWKTGWFCILDLVPEDNCIVIILHVPRNFKEVFPLLLSHDFLPCHQINYHISHCVCTEACQSLLKLGI